MMLAQKSMQATKARSITISVHARTCVCVCLISSEARFVRFSFLISKMSEKHVDF